MFLCIHCKKRAHCIIVVSYLFYPEFFSKLLNLLIFFLLRFADREACVDLNHSEDPELSNHLPCPLATVLNSYPANNLS